MELLEPDYNLPSRKTVTSRVQGLFSKQKEIVHEKLKKLSNIIKTTDCWSSRRMEGEMTLTAHGLNDNFVMENFVLDMSPVTIEDDTDDGSVARHIAENFMGSEW